MDPPMPSSIDKSPRRVVTSDGELLMRFARYRDEDAFEQLVVKHGPLVMGTCRQILRNQEDAEDAFQATFLILANRSRTIRRTHSLGSWLYSVAYRTAMRSAKKRSDLREERLSDTPAPTGDVLAQLQELEWRRVLLDELERLPERYRNPLVLCYLEGKSQGEVADETDTTRAAVKAKLMRGRRMLRVRLLRRGVALSYAIGAVSSSVSAAQPEPWLLTTSIENAVSRTPAGNLIVSSQTVLSLARDEVKDMTLKSFQQTALVATVIGLLALVLGFGLRERSLASQSSTNEPTTLALVTEQERNGSGPSDTESVTIGQIAEANRSVDKHRLRFRGKTFEEWRDVVETELDAKERVNAVLALAKFGPHGFEAELFDSVEPLATGDYIPVRWAAIRALEAAGPRAVPVLIKAIRNAPQDIPRDVPGGWPVQARIAIEVLGIFGKESEPAIPAVTEVLTSSEAGSHTHTVACQTLGRIGIKSENVLTALTDALDVSHPPHVRDSAALAIAKIGSPDKVRELVPHLLKILDERDLDNIVEATDALGRAGAVQAIPRLEELTREGARSDGGHTVASNADVKEHARRALDRIRER